MTAARALLALASEGAVPVWDRDRFMVIGPVSLATATLVAQSERSLGALVRAGAALPPRVADWPPDTLARREAAVAALLLDASLALEAALTAAETEVRVAHAWTTCPASPLPYSPRPTPSQHVAPGAARTGVPKDAGLPRWEWARRGSRRIVIILAAALCTMRAVRYAMGVPFDAPHPDCGPSIRGPP
jgi:hypothetical protein